MDDLRFTSFSTVFESYKDDGLMITGIKHQGDFGEIVSLRFQTSPCFELNEKFKCTEYIGQDEKWAETSPLNQENFFIQTSSLIPG